MPAHSQLNAIVTAFEQQATNGTPSLTILFPDSNLKSFDLHSFYFGYLAKTGATAVDVALQCTIAVAGFREGQEVTVAGYTFTLPTAAVDVSMIQAVLPGSFLESQNVTIIQGDPISKVLCCMRLPNVDAQSRLAPPSTRNGFTFRSLPPPCHLRATSVPHHMV